MLPHDFRSSRPSPAARVRSLAAVLFDLDGTLIDSIGLLLASMEHAFDGRPRVPSRAEWTAGIGTPLRTQLAEWCDSPDDVEAVVERYRTYQDRHLERMTTVYPGVLDVLAWLPSVGCAAGIVTSKGRPMTLRSLTHVLPAEPGTGHFASIVTYEDTERHKPGPEPVQLALRQLGVEADRAIFVGDSPHDMHAGRAAGVRTAAALWGPFARSELAPADPTWWLDDITDLQSIVEQLR